LPYKPKHVGEAFIILILLTFHVETQGKTQEKMERGSRKRSSSARSEKIERVGDR
jgi:hypothetical protein